ncbi:MAG: hypothetical protein KBG40_02895 [Bacteroidales bacterium]|nr:hypothetical protein [Bacteroidales bacterium]
MTSDYRIVPVYNAKGIILIIILAIIDMYPGALSAWVYCQPLSVSISVILTLSLISFFYLSGITIPFELSEKINMDRSKYEIIKYIFAQTLIYVVVGMCIANITRVNKDLTGFNSSVWAILLVISIFLIWNHYPDKENNFFTVSGLRFFGLLILVFLVFKFKSGNYENNGSLIAGYWELPGLYGWGFLVASLTWLLLRNSITGTSIIWFFFFALNIICALGMTSSLGPTRKYLGILIDGFIPSAFIAGVITGIFIRRSPVSFWTKMSLIVGAAGIVLTATGIIIGKFIPLTVTFNNNPAWALAGTGIASLFFILFFYLHEVRKISFPARLFESAGTNFFTAYIIIFLVYSIINLSGIDILIYKNSSLAPVKTGGSILFSLLITILVSAMARAGIRLKL